MANFQLFIPLLLKVEGGYQNDTNDNGNLNSLGQRVGTNHGISARFYESILKRPPTVADMKAINKQYAIQLYKQYFWDSIKGDLIENQSIANLICDHAINGGESSIGKIVQQVLNTNFGKNLVIDGDIGVKTAQAINSVNQQQFFDKIKQARESFYYAIGGSYLNGWLNRLKSFVYSEKKPLPSV